MEDLSHFDSQGHARMVDVGAKDVTSRIAVAEGRILMAQETLERIIEGKHKKGDVLAIAQIAAITGAKRTSDIIPLCHPLIIDGIDVRLEPMQDPPRVEIEVSVRVAGRTGVEMEALMGVSAAALTIYDMCKAMDRSMTIEQIHLKSKSGGQSGAWRRAEKQNSP